MNRETEGRRNPAPAKLSDLGIPIFDSEKILICRAIENCGDGNHPGPSVDTVNDFTLPYIVSVLKLLLEKVAASKRTPIESLLDDIELATEFVLEWKS